MYSNDLQFIRLKSNIGSIYDQALKIFTELGPLLDSTVRTWIYVKNIDKNYSDVVHARNEIFDNYGLTIDNHFIASTGIGGWEFEGNELVHVNALIADEETVKNIEYMERLDLLPNTHDYGVRFERGAKVEYNDCTHWYISGTASINADGEVEHPGDIISQFEKVIFNIDGLLSKYGANLNEDVYQIRVYYRNLSQEHLIKEYAEQHYPDLNFKFRKATICRPGWLVEMECTAVKSR